MQGGSGRIAGGGVLLYVMISLICSIYVSCKIALSKKLLTIVKPFLSVEVYMPTSLSSGTILYMILIRFIFWQIQILLCVAYAKT